MKKRDFEIISVSLKKKVYKTETIEVEEKGIFIAYYLANWIES